MNDAKLVDLWVQVYNQEKKLIAKEKRRVKANEYRKNNKDKLRLKRLNKRRQARGLKQL